MPYQAIPDCEENRKNVDPLYMFLCVLEWLIFSKKLKQLEKLKSRYIKTHSVV